MQKVSIEIVDQARKLAAQLLEANESDIVLDKQTGAFHVAGTPAISKSWSDVAKLADIKSGLTHEGILWPGRRRFHLGHTWPSLKLTLKRAWLNIDDISHAMMQGA